VTLVGETGTGKDVLAHALHDNSARAGSPFVVFDCGAVAANLAESELFGHERGAFTGAHASYAGAFERAEGGTLFLDEVGELPLDLQPRLLRALENRRVRRVGGNQYRPLNLRVLAATNRDLKSQVSAGRFREDLYFRLAAAVVAIPPLRERLEDIPLLVSQLLADLERADLEVAPAAYDALRSHAWPGNVRELKNTLACALAFVDPGGPLEPSHLQLLAPAVDDTTIERLPLGGHTLERIERAAIRQTLIYTRGNKVLAAQALGIAVSTLYEKLKKYRI
jgi:transcriptional regulator with PAS, ATPase and Fis domain